MSTWLRDSFTSTRPKLHVLSETVDFAALGPPSPAAVAAYVGAAAPSARIRPGLLSNPMARTNWRSVGHERLRAAMPDESACLQTPSPDALNAALRYLLFERCVNVLVINGGDGTIHHTLNAIVGVVAEARSATGLAVPLPRFLFVRGGGMNMLARVFATRGHPIRTLKRFLKRTRGAQLGTLQTRAVPLLAAVEPDGSERLGYIFGSELVFNALTMYERFGQGYRGLSRFLWEVGAGYALRTELWYQYGHLLDAPTTPLTIDGVTHPHYTSVVATTVPLQLVKGLVGTIQRSASPGGMNVVAVLPTDKGEVIRRIPALMLGARASGITYADDVAQLELTGNYTIDGERIDRRAGPHAPLVVRGSHHVVRGIWLT